MQERRWYGVDKDLVEREDAEAACAAVLDLLRTLVRSATLDVISDHSDVMPPAVREAERVLTEAGRAGVSRSRDALMALRVAADDEAWSAVEVYAAWSINVDLFDAEERNIATLHDCGYSVTAELTDAEADGLRARLVGTQVTLLSVIRERRLVEKREARRRRWGGWLSAGRRRR